MASRRTVAKLADRQRRERRATFADATPKALKRELGPTTASETPLHIRALGLDLEPEDRARVRRVISAKLGKFALSITRASVRFEDVAGPKGAPTIECRIKVLLRNASDVVVADRGATPLTAFDGAAGAVTRAVRRTIDRELPKRGRR